MREKTERTRASKKRTRDGESTKEIVRDRRESEIAREKEMRGTEKVSARF